MTRTAIRIPAAEGISVRASARFDAVAAQETLENLVSGIEDFKAQQDKRLNSLEHGLKEVNTRGALAALGTAEGFSLDEKAEREAFAKFGRSGIRAAMTTDSNPDGGYLVPRSVEKEIARIARDATPMRSLARVVTTENNTYIKTVSLNGPTATWVGEKEARNQTPGMNLAQLEFVINELQAMPAVTQTLLDDASTDVAAELATEIATAFSEKEDAAFVTGTGVKQPRGFLSQTMVANASYAWGKIGYAKSGVAAALTDETHNGVDALYDVYYALKAPYRANASWLMNSSTANVVSKLKDGDDNYLWQPSIQLGQPPTLLGRPVYVDENMPAIGANEFPIAFADWQRAYLIVDRIGVRVLRDPYSSKPYVLFYSTKRVGGGVQDFAALKLLKIEA